MSRRNAAIRTSVVIALIVILAGVVGGLYLVSPSGQPAKQEVRYPLVIADDIGRNVSIAKRSTKVVSLVPSATQIVFAVGAGDKVVGVTRYDESPPELVEMIKNGSIVIVGGGFDPNVEQIVTLNPDVILVSGIGHYQSEPVQKLQGLGFTIVSLDAQTIEGVLKDVELVGKMIGNAERAEQLVKSMREKMDSIASKLKDASKVKVYVENWHDPLFSVGQGSLQHEMIEKAGGVNIFADSQGSVQVSVEAVITKDPDVIISFNDQVGVEEIKKRPGWDQISAVRNNRVYFISPQEGAATPRIVDGLEKMAELIHPELFGSEPSRQALPTLLIPSVSMMSVGRKVGI